MLKSFLIVTNICKQQKPIYLILVIGLLSVQPDKTINNVIYRTNYCKNWCKDDAQYLVRIF